MAVTMITPARFVPQRRLNGVLAMAPDDLSLPGPVEDLAGLWIAETLWVTNAGGAAAALAAVMTGREPAVAGLDVLHAQRFRDRPRDELRERALRLDRDIYATA